MRNLDAFLNSPVNIDRNSLIAILASEAEAARQLVNSARQRTASQRGKRQQAIQRVARIERIGEPTWHSLEQGVVAHRVGDCRPPT